MGLTRAACTTLIDRDLGAALATPERREEDMREEAMVRGRWGGRGGFTSTNRNLRRRLDKYIWDQRSKRLAPVTKRLTKFCCYLFVWPFRLPCSHHPDVPSSPSLQI